MDIANAPRSDQWNADDLVSGPITVTIREVVKGKAEQPYDFLLVESDRCWRPGVTMRRLMAGAWGTNDGDVYPGRRVTLYRDPEVSFGKDKTGGIRISHLSHITERYQTKLQTTRGKREMFTVEPLADAPTQQAAPSPAATLLAEIATAAEAASIPLATIATEWAESHDGQDIRQATDIGGLELVCDDLRGKSGAEG